MGINLFTKYEGRGWFPIYVSIGGAKKLLYYFVLVDDIQIGYGGQKDRQVKYILKEFPDVGSRVDYRSFFVCGILGKNENGQSGWETVPVNLSEKDVDKDLQKTFLRSPKNIVLLYFSAIFTQIDMERHPDLYAPNFIH